MKIFYSPTAKKSIYITRQIKFIKENIRLIVESIEPFKMDKKYNKNQFCSVFKRTDLSSSFMGGSTTKEEYINKKKKSIEARIQQASAKLLNVFVKALLWC